MRHPTECPFKSPRSKTPMSWFSWTSNPHVHWAPQVIFIQGLNYIIDVYMMFANSASAANTLIRSIAGGAFRLFASLMYQNMG